LFVQGCETQDKEEVNYEKNQYRLIIKKAMEKIPFSFPIINTGTSDLLLRTRKEQAKGVKFKNDKRMSYVWQILTLPFTGKKGFKTNPFNESLGFVCKYQKSSVHRRSLQQFMKCTEI
jgi:hypothetical protein